MKIRAVYVGITVMVIFLVLIAGCSSSTPTTKVSSPVTTSSTGTTTTGYPTTTLTGIQIYANPITENMLTALSNNDYAGFAKDMDQAAKNAISATAFSQLYDKIKNIIGTYESALFFGSSTQGSNTTVNYIAHYTDEPAGVSVLVVFQTVNGTHYVHGFTLDSPKLRGQTIDVSQIRVYADAETENVLVSLSNNDYTAFSKNLDKAMKSAFSKTSFNQLYNKIKTTVGNYTSKEFESASTQNNIITIKYLTKYTDEPSGVWVTISFNADQQIAGLLFNSPKLIGQ